MSNGHEWPDAPVELAALRARAEAAEQLLSDARRDECHQARLAKAWQAKAEAAEAERAEARKLEGRRIVCLCGSTRFTDEMLVVQWNLTKRGCIVLSWCSLPDWYFKGEDQTHIGDQECVKEIVDEVHKRKIDLCTEVFVINIDGYIGESTRSEIDYAVSIGRPVLYLEPLAALEAKP